MKSDHILYLTDFYFAFSEVTTGGLSVKLQKSLNDADSLELLGEFLQQNIKGNINVVLDVLGEEVKQEDIPHVSAKDRRLLIQRKTKSVFPNATLFWQKHIARKKTGRKDDVYLLAGIQCSPQVNKILEYVTESNVSVSGIYSISILSRELLKVIPKNEQCLLIARVLDGDESKVLYRQSFFKNNELVLSRVVRTLKSKTQNNFDQLFSEIERMQHFLLGAGQLDSHKPLKLMAALSKTEAEQLFNHQTKANIEYQCVDLGKAALKMGLNKHPKATSLAELLGLLISEKRIKPHFKPKELCRVYTEHTIKRVLNLSTVGVLCCAMALSLGLWWATNKMQTDATQMKQNIAALTYEKQQVEGVVATSEIKPRLMEQVVDLYKVIKTSNQQVESVLEAISAAKIGFQEVTVNVINFESTTASVKDDDVEGTAGFFSQQQGDKFIALDVSFSRSLTNREILNKLESFILALQQQMIIKSVTRGKSAIDIRSTERISGSIDEGRNTDELSFSLRLSI